jgi:hypothetical protein
VSGEEDPRPQGDSEWYDPWWNDLVARWVTGDLSPAELWKLFEKRSKTWLPSASHGWCVRDAVKLFAKRKGQRYPRKFIVRKEDVPEFTAGLVSAGWWVTGISVQRDIEPRCGLGPSSRIDSDDC